MNTEWKEYEQLRFDWYFTMAIGCLLLIGSIGSAMVGIFLNIGVAISHYSNDIKRFRDWAILNIIVWPIVLCILYYSLNSFCQAYTIAVQMHTLLYH